MKRDRKLHPWCMGCWRRFKFWQRGVCLDDIGWVHRRCRELAIERAGMRQ